MASSGACLRGSCLGCLLEQTSGSPRATIIALIRAAIVSVTNPVSAESLAEIVIDPEIRALVLAGQPGGLVVTSRQLDRKLKQQQ